MLIIKLQIYPKKVPATIYGYSGGKVMKPHLYL